VELVVELPELPSKSESSGSAILGDGVLPVLTRGGIRILSIEHILQTAEEFPGLSQRLDHVEVDSRLSRDL
jgi:hypothetical protein